MSVLDESQRAVLRAVLNRIVPARVDLPGAGDLDVTASIERAMAASSRIRRLFLDGLTEIAITAVRDQRMAFVDLDAARQTAVLHDVERDWPVFFVALVEYCYRGYYALPAVHQAIGYESRAPQPLGYRLAPFDAAILDQQRLRAPFWRPIERSSE